MYVVYHSVIKGTLTTLVNLQYMYISWQLRCLLQQKRQNNNTKIKKMAPLSKGMSHQMNIFLKAYKIISAISVHAQRDF